MCEDTKEGYSAEKKQLIAALLKNISFKAIVKRPNTVVFVTFHTEEKDYHVVSFAKVSGPDKWNPKVGVEIAVRKAAASLAKTMLLSPKKLKKMYPPVENARSIELANVDFSSIVLPDF